MENSIKILVNEDISKYTTVKIGGTAKKMYFPKDTSELAYILQLNNSIPIIGGGSNLLIANKEFDEIINMREFDNTVVFLGGGRFYAGAGVRNQKIIKEINKLGFGGIEYLFSVPGLLGGAIVMNAGSGLKENKCISDYLTKVYVVNREGKEETFTKSKCKFAHRNSIFRENNQYIIVGAEFDFEAMDQSTAQERIAARIQYCKETQDNSASNFGSVFKIANHKILTVIQKIGLGNKKGVHFSKKSANWLLNEGNKESFAEAVRLINIVMFIHKLLRKRCEVEVVIWK